MGCGTPSLTTYRSPALGQIRGRRRDGRASPLERVQLVVVTTRQRHDVLGCVHAFAVAAEVMTLVAAR